MQKKKKIKKIISLRNGDKEKYCGDIVEPIENFNMLSNTLGHAYACFHSSCDSDLQVIGGPKKKTYRLVQWVLNLIRCGGQ